MLLFQNRKKITFYLKFQFKMKKRKILNIFFLQNYRYENNEVEIYRLKLVSIIYFG